MYFLTLREKYEDKTIEEWRAPISEGGLVFALPEDYIYYLSSSDNGHYLGWKLAFQVSETGVSSSNTSLSGGGYIRCVIKTDYKSLSDITSMQEMNKDVVINTPNDTTKILTDTRDDNVMDVFSPVGGGIYRDGVLRADSWIGFWWIEIINTYNGNEYGMVYGYSSNTNNYWTMVDMDSQLSRHNGAYVRCSAPNYTP